MADKLDGEHVGDYPPDELHLQMLRGTFYCGEIADGRHDLETSDAALLRVEAAETRREVMAGLADDEAGRIAWFAFIRHYHPGDSDTQINEHWDKHLSAHSKQNYFNVSNAVAAAVREREVIPALAALKARQHMLDIALEASGQWQARAEAAEAERDAWRDRAIESRGMMDFVITGKNSDPDAAPGQEQTTP